MVKADAISISRMSEPPIRGPRRFAENPRKRTAGASTKRSSSTSGFGAYQLLIRFPRCKNGVVRSAETAGGKAGSDLKCGTYGVPKELSKNQ
jgi:hypothetical protein